MGKNCTCGIDYEGTVNADNLVDFWEDIENDYECKSLCSSDSACNAYTYYNESHNTDAKLCILLTELQMPVQKCLNCQTGAADTCNAFEECSMGVWDDGSSV